MHPCLKPCVWIFRDDLVIVTWEYKEIIDNLFYTHAQRERERERERERDKHTHTCSVLRLCNQFKGQDHNMFFHNNPFFVSFPPPPPPPPSSLSLSLSLLFFVFFFVFCFGWFSSQTSVLSDNWLHAQSILYGSETGGLWMILKTASSHVLEVVKQTNKQQQQQQRIEQNYKSIPRVCVSYKMKMQRSERIIIMHSALSLSLCSFPPSVWLKNWLSGGYPARRLVL